jgi:hypothetical protein
MSIEMPTFDDALGKKVAHIGMLKERVFQVARWPHYNLLLEDLQELSLNLGYEDGRQKILSFERTLLYGGKSMFAPIFYGHDYRIREASPESAYERGPYNAGMIDGRFMEYGKPAAPGMWSHGYDLVLLPNAVHHAPVDCHSMLFSDCSAVLRPGGYLYIYEQFIEEIHQKPDDYVRYTPHGLATLLEAAGYQIEYVRQTGDIYTSTTFLLDQILEYIEGGQPREGVSHLDHGMAKAEDIRRIQGMIKTLQKMAPNYPHNGLRSHTECPKAFSVLARKPV